MTRLTVVGDCLLDRDWTGTSARLCPDSTGPVVDLRRQLDRPGGAAFAAAAAARAGATVQLIAATGNDDAGERLRSLIAESGVTLIDLGSSGPTPEKVRVRVGDQTVARLDVGCEQPARPLAWTSSADDAIAWADAVLVSDYGRGMLMDDAARAALERDAGRRPVVWDPHPRGARPFASTTVATPSMTEAGAAVGDASLSAADVASRLASKWRCSIAVTCGPLGAVLAHRGRITMHATSASVGDACGAGDHFAANVSIALGNGEPIETAVDRGVAAASAFVAGRQAGGARALAKHWHDRGGIVVSAGGCFDVLHPGHVAMLRHARSLGDCLIVCVNDDASVARLKGPNRPMNTTRDRVDMLLALECVDEVEVFSEDDPTAVLAELRPDIFVKGMDYAGVEIPERALLATWGGRVELAPLVGGHSTTRLLRLASRAAG